jgi:hypothetical protein
MKRSLVKKKKFHFLTFELDATNYRGRLVENVKKVNNQPTLMDSTSTGTWHLRALLESIECTVLIKIRRSIPRVRMYVHHLRGF